jgi:sugar (pentulose or hexulose) kinase
MTIRGYLGIDLGTQGVSVIVTDESTRVLAAGDAPYEMVEGLADDCYEQRPADWERGVASATAAAAGELARTNRSVEILAIGISGQMHGEVLADRDGRPLAPVRLWCDSRNEAEGEELTERLGVKCPKRLTAARWLWTIRNRPDLAERVASLTTPGGWLAWRLTGSRRLGIGDASGMFPIQQAALDYDRRLLAIFDAAVADAGVSRVPPLVSLLPEVRVAGGDGGSLSADGLALLGGGLDRTGSGLLLTAGIPVGPAEGDQPAALAGSLIASPGMVAMSFGTSVCANSVGDRSFQGVSRSIDHFCAPDGRPINMAWLRNGTTWMNRVVEMAGGPNLSDAFAAVMPLLLAADDDCGGIASLPFMDDEPGLGVSRGGTGLVVGLDDRSATPGNLAKAALLATVFNLRLAGEPLESQGFPRTEIVLSGGLVRTPALGQLIADAFDTPVTILDAASEGSAYGAILLARYRAERLAAAAGVREGAPAGPGGDWPTFLASHAAGSPKRFQPRRPSVTVLGKAYERHRRLVALHAALDAALHGT